MAKKKPETATDRTNAAEIKRATRKKPVDVPAPGLVDAVPVPPVSAPDTVTQELPAETVRHAYHVGGYDFVA